MDACYCHSYLAILQSEARGFAVAFAITDELGLYDVPVLGVDVVVFQGLPPGDGIITEDHVELVALFLVLVPLGDVGGRLQALDQVPG